MDHNYQPPVDKLLTIGECEMNEFGDYSGYGFTTEHIPELIRMTRDDSLHWAPSDSFDHSGRLGRCPNRIGVVE